MAEVKNIRRWSQERSREMSQEINNMQVHKLDITDNFTIALLSSRMCWKRITDKYIVSIFLEPESSTMAVLCTSAARNGTDGENEEERLG